MKERARGGSLRTRLILSLCAVLFPFVVAAAIGAFYLMPALLGPLEDILTEVVEEMEPVRRLQVALLSAAIGAGDSDEFSEAVPRVERALASVRAAPFLDTVERDLIEAVAREWLQARSIEEKSRRLDVKNAATTAVPEIGIVAHVERATTLLDSMQEPMQRELALSRSAARTAKTKSIWVTFSAFLVALAISVYGTASLARSVITDVNALREGALRFARGDLSHRVEGSGENELGDLAAAFNAMAERIQADQATLAELATRDSLTGLLNRREFLRLLREELDRSRRYGHSCALLMLDVDRFKLINDTWGHPVGDAALRAVAARMLNELRPADGAARYGGEEFVVLLPQIDARGACAAAERIRAAIADTPVTVSPDRAIEITVSIGVTAYPEHGASEEPLMASVDVALYAAKESGRNRVVVATGGVAG